jgi:D-aspartate ligase
MDVDRPSAIIVGLDCSTGLQTCRLLARRGIRVIGIAGDARHPATRTNTCARVVAAPVSGEGLMAALADLGRSEPGAVLFPCTDGSVATLAHHREALQAFQVVLPDGETVDRLMDKEQFAELMEEQGLPAPRAMLVDSETTAHAVANRLAFPCVVKPTLKTPAWEAAGPKVRRFEDSEAWIDAAPELLRLHPRLLVQEWIDGGDDTLYSCNCYISPRGTPNVTFVARKLRQWPPRTGVSCLGEAVMDEGIRDLALDVLSSVNFSGLGYVEIKRSPVDGKDHVIEANVGRPTGRSAIAEAGGVELLYTMYCDAVGAPLPVDRPQRDHPVKWLDLRRDLRSSLHYLRSGELTISAWYRSLRGPKVYADLDLTDLRPFAAELARDVTRLLRRLTGTGRRRRARLPVRGTPVTHPPHTEGSTEGATGNASRGLEG